MNVEPICRIFNNSVKYGIFPDELKIVLVLPVHKNGNHDDIQNYMPVTTLSVFSKIFEKDAYCQILEYFNFYNL